MKNSGAIRRKRPPSRLRPLLVAVSLCLLPFSSALAVSVPLARPKMTAKTVLQMPVPEPKPNDDSLLRGTEITLQEAIFVGLKNNRAIERACISRISERYRLKVEEAQFSPRLGLSGETSRFVSGSLNTTRANIAPKAQLSTSTGARIEFAWNNNTSISKELRDWSSVAELSAEQPLLRGGGVKVNLAPLEQARLAEKANMLHLNATVSEIVGNIIFSYRDLLLSQEELILARLAVQRAEKLVTNNEALINAGRMAAVDIIQTQADLENQRIRVLQVMQNVVAAKLNLTDLLALDLDTKLIAIKATDPNWFPLNIQRLISIALVKRPDYLGQLNIIAQSRYGLVIAQNEKLWDLKLFARGRYGLETGSQSAFKNVSEATFGLRFNIELNDPAPQQKYIQASTNKQIAHIRLEEIRQGIEKQIRGTASEVTLLWEQLKLARTAEMLARKAVEVEAAKLNAGRSTTFQVRALEDRLRNSENRFLSARIGYQNALTRLDLQLGTTLETWRVNLPKMGGDREQCH